MPSTRRSFLASLAALLTAPIAIAAARKAPIQDITRAGGTLVGPRDVVPVGVDWGAQTTATSHVVCCELSLEPDPLPKRRHLHHGHPRRGQSRRSGHK